MLVASVHDPALFTEDCQNDPAVRSALIDHVMHMAHCHIPVVDRKGVLGQALLKDLKSLPAHIIQLLNALVSDASRVVRLDVPAAALQALKEYLPDISAQAMAMADKLASRITYFELSVDPKYMDEYSQALFFPHTDLARFPTVRF